jgi:hypothetical protein
MGASLGVDSTMAKITCYFILGEDNRDVIELGSESNDEEYISSYYTRDKISPEFLLNVIREHEYSYEWCQLQDMKIKRQDNRWTLYLYDDVLGYVKVKRGLLVKEFAFVWDKKKLDQREELYEKNSESK